MRVTLLSAVFLVKLILLLLNITDWNYDQRKNSNKKYIFES